MQFNAAHHLYAPGGGTLKLLRAPLELNANTGIQSNSDVAGLQQLLAAAGQPVNITGVWEDKTNTALEAFQKSQGLCSKKHLNPNDDDLFRMAKQANILIPLPGQKGWQGVLTLHNWLKSPCNRVYYDPKPHNGSIWGLHGRTNYAVYLKDREFQPGPPRMECTKYVNLTLSVFKYGNAHNPKYKADTHAFGGAGASGHLAEKRYGMGIVRRLEGNAWVSHYRSVSQIESAATSNALYVLELGTDKGGGTGHMALLYNGRVYESTKEHNEVDQTISCRDTALRDFLWNKHRDVHRSPSVQPPATGDFHLRHNVYILGPASA
jgi:hypothetical protein